MKLIAATIPGLQDIYSENTSRLPQFIKLNDVLSGLLNIVFYIAVFITFYFLVWGAFAYIIAQGKKEDLAKARERITWSLIGLIIILLSFAIIKFVAEILQTKINIKGGLPF
ncbi:hypothetical protein KKE78_04520 [Patescibacteria group bacterium]|nr:hypothetical protein [Patescibacteria group bacterium]